MLEHKWAAEYVKALFEMSGKGPYHLLKLVETSGLRDIEDPLLEIRFLHHGGSAGQAFNLALAELAVCREDTPLGMVAELIETVDDCNWKLLKAAEELPRLKEAVEEDPNSGEKLAKLGFGFN